MKIYITLEQAIEHNNYDNFEKLLRNLGLDLIGAYESRGYNTIVAEGKPLEDDVEQIIQDIKNQIPTLEVGIFMKFYAVLSSRVRPLDVNPILRKRLAEEKYEAIVYPSHSENGINYVGINIKDFNPLDIEEMNRFKQLVEQIRGINNLINY